MIDIGSTDFYIGVPSLPRLEFEEYSTRLFDEWESYVERTLQLPDYYLALEVEEGSVKGVGKVAALLGALYIGIGNYGSFISGLQTIHGQVNSVGNYLAKRAADPFVGSGVKPKVRKHGGSLSRLEGIFVKVQRGEMTVEQAMLESEAIIGGDAAAAPMFMQEFQVSLEQLPLFPKQLPLTLDGLDQETLLPEISREQRPRQPRTKPKLPPPQQFRVEVWRESKNDERRVRVIQL